MLKEKAGPNYVKLKASAGWHQQTDRRLSVLSTCSAPVLGWEQSWRGSESSSLGRRGAPGACRCPRLRWCTHVHTRVRTTPIPFRLSSTLSSQSCALYALVPSLTLSLL